MRLRGTSRRERRVLPELGGHHAGDGLYVCRSGRHGWNNPGELFDGHQTAVQTLAREQNSMTYHVLLADLVCFEAPLCRRST